MTAIPLPLDCIKLIGLESKPKDLLNILISHKQFLTIDNEQFWKQKLNKDYPLISSTSTYKEQYKREYQKQQCRDLWNNCQLELQQNKVTEKAKALFFTYNELRQSISRKPETKYRIFRYCGNITKPPFNQEFPFEVLTKLLSDDISALIKKHKHRGNEFILVYNSNKLITYGYISGVTSRHRYVIEWKPYNGYFSLPSLYFSHPDLTIDEILKLYEMQGKFDY